MPEIHYMDYHIAKPSPVLSPFVKHYWAIQADIPTGERYIQRIVPSGLSGLTFYFDEIPETINTGRSIPGNSFLTGQSDEYFDIKVKGSLSMFSISFQPQSLSLFFDIPVHELSNQLVPLHCILKDVSNELESRLFEAQSFAAKISITEDFLLERLRKISAKYHFQRINTSIALINHCRGLINIDQLASKACFSRKQFERTFLSIVGVSPKRFLNIVRFQNAINEKSRVMNDSHPGFDVSSNIQS